LEENGFTDYLKPAGGEKYVWTFPGESQTEE